MDDVTAVIRLAQELQAQLDTLALATMPGDARLDTTPACSPVGGANLSTEYRTTRLSFIRGGGIESPAAPIKSDGAGGGKSAVPSLSFSRQ
jgi:hypothetical protein